MDEVISFAHSIGWSVEVINPVNKVFDLKE
jgi:hypothetical protein